MGGWEGEGEGELMIALLMILCRAFLLSVCLFGCSCLGFSFVFVLGWSSGGELGWIPFCVDSK